MRKYNCKDKVASPPSPTRWRPDRETTDTPIQILNIRRVHQAKRPHFVRADVHLGGIIVFNVLASSVGVAWPRKFGDPVVTIHDEALRRRIEAALREAARLENAGVAA